MLNTAMKMLKGLCLNTASSQIEGRTIDTAPRRMGAVQVGHHFSWGLVEFEWKNMGRYSLDPEHSFEYEGHDLFNLRTLWQIDSSLSVSMRLLNILDEDYAERADVTFGASPEPRYFVGESRSVYLSLDKTF